MCKVYAVYRTENKIQTQKIIKTLKLEIEKKYVLGKKLTFEAFIPNSLDILCYVLELPNQF